MTDYNLGDSDSADAVQGSFLIQTFDPDSETVTPQSVDDITDWNRTPNKPTPVTNMQVDSESGTTPSLWTVSKVYRAIARKVKAASRTVAGIIELGDNAEYDATEANASDARAVTVKGFWRMFTGARIVSRLAALTGANRLSYNSLQDTPSNPIQAIGSAVTITGNNKIVASNLESGDVIEFMFKGSKATLDSGQPFMDSLKVYWDDVPNGQFRAAPAFTARLAGTNNGILDGNELVLFTGDTANNRIQARVNSTAWANITLTVRAQVVKSA